MGSENQQYLLHCNADNSYCVVYEEDLIFDKKIKLECGSTVWFMYQSQGTEKPYRGTILEISGKIFVHKYNISIKKIVYIYFLFVFFKFIKNNIFDSK